MSDSKSKPPTLDLNDDLVNEIAFSVHSTFTSMFSLRPTALVHFTENECAVDGEVSGIIGIAQDHVEGALIVSFPTQTIFAVLGKMYKKEFTAVDKSVRGGVGELTNIIYGVLKTNLNKKGFGFKMALPTVVCGDQHRVAISSLGTTLVVPFQTDLGSFSILLTLYPQQMLKSNAA